MHWFDDFETRNFEVAGACIHARVSPGLAEGRNALLLLHGFPQSHVMWHRVAQLLHREFFLVMPDLRGYGDSSKPASSPDHASYSKRAMAQDVLEVMTQLGITRFGVCGHDRGARVAHRLALDHPLPVERLCLMDIAPTLDMYDATDFAFASAYYHWFHLIQPHPLPEAMLQGCALQYLHTKLGGWGTAGLGHIETAALAEYERCFCKPETIHAVCEDYRASAGIDLEHDRQSRALQSQGGGKITCDTLVLWGQRGVVQRLFQPLSLWRAQCSARVSGHALDAGHFLAEELSGQTAAELARFFGG
jgi:haloacetate dehalogenase